MTAAVFPLGTTVSSSDPGFLSEFQAPLKKYGLPPRLTAEYLRGRFQFKAAGRNSCGSIPSTAAFKLGQVPGGGLFSQHSLHCNSISSCPHCRQRIMSRRGDEIQACIDYFLAGLDLPIGEKNDRHVLLLTLTFPHYQRDTLHDLLGSTKYLRGLRGARSHLFGKSYFAKQTRAWLIPAVNGIEVTYGANGSHPHLHALLFVDCDKMPSDSLFLAAGRLDVAGLRDYISRAWMQSCELAGLRSPDFEHGCDLSPGATAAHYLAKWTAGSEMSDAYGNKERSTFTDSISIMERRLVAGESRPQDVSCLAEYYREMYGVRIHNWSKKVKHYRQIFASTHFSSVVARSVGSGTPESVQYLNSARPAQYLSQCEQYPDIPLSDLIPGFETDFGAWHLLGSDYEAEPDFDDIAEFYIQYAMMEAFNEEYSVKKRKFNPDRFEASGRYGRANRWFIPNYPAQSK